MVLALNVLVAGLLGVPEAVLIGSNQGYRSINLNTVFLVVSTASMAIAATNGLGPVTFAIILGVSAAVNGLFTWVVARRRIDWWGVQKPTSADVKNLARLSGWTLLWMLVQQLMLSTELILFACLMGLTQVAQYSITAYASQSALAVCLLTTSAMIPGLGALLGAGRAAEAAERVRQTRDMVTAVAVIASCALLLFNQSFVGLWAGESHYLGSNLNALITVAFFQIAVTRCDAQILDATLNVRDRAIYGVFVSGLALGAALAVFLITARIEFSYLALIACRLVLQLVYAADIGRQIPQASYPWKSYLLALGMMLGCFILGTGVYIQSWLMLGFAATIGLALLALCSYVLMLSPDTRRKLNLTHILGFRS